MSALIDFDYWLECQPTSSSIRDQILLHEQLAVLSGGYLLPIAPYNPWSDIERDEASFKLVQEAVTERGFIGVKIYPPMGFTPSGDVSGFETTLPMPDSDELKKRMSRLYAWCSENSVPVMAHTSHSMGRDLAHDDLASPLRWQEVFRKFTQLHVNGGHFGGFSLSSQENGVRYWPDIMLDMMGSDESPNYYADLSYLNGLFINGSTQQYQMHEWLSDKRSSRTRERIMYGSDWHMISQISDWNMFAYQMRQFIKTVSVPDNVEYQKNIFGYNAARLFGLHKGEANRLRLEKFYEKWGVVKPRWADSLDKLG